MAYLEADAEKIPLDALGTTANAVNWTIEATVKGDTLSIPRATGKRVCSAWNLAQGGFFKFAYSERQLF